MECKGLLYSQIGYELHDPKRALVRSTDSSYIKAKTTFEVIDIHTGEQVFRGDVKLWGEIWKSTWWEIDFSQLNRAGQYKIVVKQGGGEGASDEVGTSDEVCSSDIIKIDENILWNESIIPVAIEQMEERSRLSRNGIGWKDCGSAFREVNSHTSTIIGLCDTLNFGFPYLAQDELRRLTHQIMHGCELVAGYQDKAERLGYHKGAVIHEIPNFMTVIPGDVAQSAVAFAYTSRLVSETNPEKSDEYLYRAQKALDYLLKHAHPYGGEGFCHFNHGAPEGFNVPGEWMTRDLLMMLWGAMELYASGKGEYKEAAISLADRIIKRQVPKSKSEDGLYGHFYTFQSCDFTEKAFIHHCPGHDCGGTFPHYILPLTDMLRRWFDHPNAPVWREAVENFAYGYFLPACSSNPFYLMPMGYFTGEGLLNFCGPWHGFNTSIAYASSLATQLEMFLGDKSFRNIAVGCVQWIAGLNAGLTSESFNNFTLWKTEIEPGKAEPYSLISGIGRNNVGNWTGIRGTIPNGFSVNPQFEHSVKPSKESDGPWLFTDEDWIPHSGGWASALSYIMDRRFYHK